MLGAPGVLIIVLNNAAIGIATSLFLRSLNSILKTFASALELMFTAVLCWVCQMIQACNMKIIFKFQWLEFWYVQLLSSIKVDKWMPHSKVWHIHKWILTLGCKTCWVTLLNNISGKFDASQYVSGCAFSDMCGLHNIAIWTITPDVCLIWKNSNFIRHTFWYSNWNLRCVSLVGACRCDP